MGELPHDTGFQQEPFTELAVADPVRQQDLHGDLPVQVGVVAPPNLPHPSGGVQFFARIPQCGRQRHERLGFGRAGGRALARCAGGLIHGQAIAVFAEFPFEEAFHLGSILGCEPMALDEEIGELIVELRSATAGAGSFTRQFERMAEVTGRAADQIIAANRAAA